MAEETRQNSDPSANVLLLVGNAVKYLEDLHREGTRSVDERLKLHFEYTKRESDAESERINTLRKVDVDAVGIANERAVKQAEVLAAQVATSAEALRILVAQTATTIAQQLALVTSQLIERIAALEKVQYENMGKSGAPSDLALKVEALEKVISSQQGSDKGSTITKANFYTVITVGIAILGAIILIGNNFFR